MAAQETAMNTAAEELQVPQSTLQMLRQLIQSHPSLRDQAHRILRQGGVTLSIGGQQLAEEEEEEDDDDDDDGDLYFNRWDPPRSPAKFFPKVTEPVEAGVNLLNSGEFGSVDLTGKKARGIKRAFPAVLRDREMARQKRTREELGRAGVSTIYRIVLPADTRPRLTSRIRTGRLWLNMERTSIPANSQRTHRSSLRAVKVCVSTEGHINHI